MPRASDTQLAACRSHHCSAPTAGRDATGVLLDLTVMTRQRLPHRQGRSGRLTVRFVVFAGSLAGLFAMHGLSDHAGPGHDANAAMGPSMVAVSDTGHTADAEPAARGSSPVDDAPDQDSSGGMVGLCLTVLAGAILGSLMLRPLRIAVFTRPSVLTLVAGPGSGRRERDPPCLFELGVLRT